MTEVPATLGRYRLQDPLGRGGDAPLYFATDPSNRPVVIRLLPGHSEALQRRFVREALPAIRLRHPHIVRTLELGGDSGRPFVVMEYFEGRTLAEVLREGQPLPIPRALSLIEQLCSAVAFARARNLLRRDLRPDDVMVARDGVLKLVDFGIARPLETTAAPPPSHEFIAPEQAEGGTPDARSDVYTIGTLLFSLLGSRRTVGPERSTVAAQGGHEPVADPPTSCPGVDIEIMRIVNRCIEKQPDRRYPDAEALAADLKQVSARLHDVAPGELPAEPQHCRRRRSRPGAHPGDSAGGRASPHGRP